MIVTRLFAVCCVLCVVAPQCLANTLVEFDTSLGTFEVSLYDGVAPQTVANFLAYVNSSAYDDTIVHRVDTGLGVIQGGGFDTLAAPIPTNSPIPLEYNLPNVRGALAMARTIDPNSATDQWFINTVDNSQTLGQANGGGYAVFGQVVGNGMDIVDAIAGVPTFAYISPFSQLPLRNFTQADYNNQVSLTTDNFVIINSITVVPEPSSLLLAALGIMALAAFGWPRRKRPRWS